MGIYYYFKTKTAMPKRVSGEAAITETACGKTRYGCCPDGITVSNSDRLNCATECQSTPYGCCPDGTTSNIDQSNCKF